MQNTKAKTSQKNKARYLIIVKGFSQKEAAKVVGVSEKTMTAWAKKYNWQDAMLKVVKHKGGLNGFMEDFFIYVRSAAPALLEDIKKHWFGFLKNHEKEINN